MSKFRLDFVTNSSSSSFIVASKKAFTQKQKDAIFEFVMQKFVQSGRHKETISTKEELEQYVKDNDWLYNGKIDEYYQEKYDAMKKAIKKGQTIYTGWVSHECSDDDLCEIYETIWEILRKNSDGNFTIIDDDLSY